MRIQGPKMSTSIGISRELSSVETKVVNHGEPLNRFPLLLPTTLRGLVRFCVVSLCGYPFIVGRFGIKAQKTRVGEVWFSTVQDLIGGLQQPQERAWL